MHTAHRPLVAKLAILLAVMSSVAGILTGLMTWANTGFSDAFLPNWGISFLKALFVLLPFAFLLMGLFDRILMRLLPNQKQMARRIVLGLIMAVIMQSLMAAITAGTESAFGDFAVFKGLWLNAFVTAFPIGLTLALILTTSVRPWLMTMLRN